MIIIDLSPIGEVRLDLDITNLLGIEYRLYYAIDKFVINLFVECKC